MKLGEQCTSGNNRPNTPVDYRFAQTVKNILEHEFAPGGVRLTICQMALGMNVSRTTIYCWLNGTTGISRGAVRPFLEHRDWRGIFARKVWEIHDDHLRWRLESNTKAFRKWRLRSDYG